MLLKCLTPQIADAVESGAIPSATTVAAQLQRSALSLVDRFVSADGDSVDYDRMRRSRALRHHTALAGQLRGISIEDLAALL